MERIRLNRDAKETLQLLYAINSACITQFERIGKLCGRVSGKERFETVKSNLTWVILRNDLMDLADYATDTQCFCCDGKKQDCRLRKILKELPADGADTMRVPCWRDD